MKTLLLVLFCISLISTTTSKQAFAAKTAVKPAKSKDSEKTRVALLAKYDKYKAVYGSIKTNFGKITVKLFPKESPFAVDNFVSLAEGTKEFIDVNDPKFPKVKRPFYNGLSFHRIAPNFVIQGGCPKGNGTGGPGYVFNDEFSNLLDFGRPGMLAMANSGKNSNGSQFFITLARANFLNKSYTIFGKVTDGMDVVKKIGKVPTYPNERPRKKVIIKEITIDKLAHSSSQKTKK